MQQNHDSKVDTPDVAVKKVTSSRTSSVRTSARVDTNSTKVYSSGANTFFALQDNLVINKEFKFDPLELKTQRKAEYRAAKFIALELISLWIPRRVKELYNYTMHYKYQAVNDKMLVSPICYTSTARHYTQIDAKIMRDGFAKGESYHLGSLIFLNYILDGCLTDKNLGIVHSLSGIYYFMQRAEGALFFARFLNRQDTTLGQLNLMDFIESSKHTEWWDKVIPEEITDKHTAEKFLRRLFLPEIFQTVLRIHLTPVRVIDMIVNELTDPDFNYSELKSYITQLKCTNLTFFVDSLSDEEFSEWKIFLKEHSQRVYDIYKNDLHTCLNKFDYMSNNEFYSHCMLDMFVNADKCRLPGLEKRLGFDHRVLGMTTTQKVTAFNYFYYLITSQSNIYGSTHDYVVWKYFDSLCSSLCGELNGTELECQDDERKLHSVQALMMFACRFKFNNICCFLLIRYPFLAKSLVQASKILMDPYDMYIGVPMVIYATNIGNSVIAYYIELAIANDTVQTSKIPAGSANSQIFLPSIVDKGQDTAILQSPYGK